jgi:hypothetical protein
MMYLVTNFALVAPIELQYYLFVHALSRRVLLYV